MNPAGDPPVYDEAPAEPVPSYPFWGYEDLGMFVGMILPSVLLAVLLIAGGGMIWPAFFKRPVVQTLGGQLLTYAFAFGGLRQLFAARYDRPLLRSLGWRISFPGALWAALAGPVLAYSIGLLGMTLKAPLLKNPFETMMQSTLEVAAVGLFAVLLGPLAEELVFRGFLLPLLTRSLGPVAAVGLTALLFALLHGPQYSWAWQHVALVGSAGVVFGITRLWTRSTASSFVMHATYNLFFFGIALLQRSTFPEPI